MPLLWSSVILLSWIYKHGAPMELAEHVKIWSGVRTTEDEGRILSTEVRHAIATNQEATW